MVVGIAAKFGMLAISHLAARNAPWYIKLGRGYQRYNKFMEKFGPMGYGAQYAGGTVLGYHGISQFFKPKWRYLGSPQRLKKI